MLNRVVNIITTGLHGVGVQHSYLKFCIGNVQRLSLFQEITAVCEFRQGQTAHLFCSAAQC